MHRSPAHFLAAVLLLLSLIIIGGSTPYSSYNYYRCYWGALCGNMVINFFWLYFLVIFFFSVDFVSLFHLLSEGLEGAFFAAVPGFFF